MTLRLWRTAYASVAGTSHITSGMPCQDAGRCVVVKDRAGNDILLAAVSDGAGSASRSEFGADLTVETFMGVLSGAVAEDSGDLAFLSRDFMLQWLAGTRAALAQLAATDGFNMRDYACTFLGAIVARRSSTYVQVGDGAIIVSDEEDGDPGYVFWPQHGVFANSTYFITQEDAEDVMLFERADFEGPHNYVREIALFSDGLERLILDFKARAVHTPALKPIFNWLAAAEAADGTRPSEALMTYLASSHVNRRTDDDKTLVMATRALPPAEKT